MEEIETRFGSGVILFPTPNEVSHWQAACESGRVWLRLLQSGGFTKLAGVSYAVVQPNSKRGADGGTDVEGLTAVNVGLQDGRWMVRRWMWDSGTDMQRTGRCFIVGRYNVLHWMDVASL